MPLTDNSATEPAPFPSAFQAALAVPPLERKSWQATTLPSFLGLFLWVVFFDVLAVRTLPVGGLGWSVLGVLAAGLLCYQLLYLVPATWGFRTGRPLTIVSASTFGARGATWLAGLLMALANIVWFAVAIAYGADLFFQALVVYGLLDPKSLKEIVVAGWTVPGPLYLVATFFWSFWAAIAGAYLVRIIAGLMRVFSIFIAALLALVMIGTLKGLPAFAATGIDPTTSETIVGGGSRACVLMIQLIFGFFATAGVAAVDWGAVNRDARDVRLGGLAGVAGASWVIATLALLAVAGAVGLNAPPPPALMVNFPAVAYTFHQAVVDGIGGWRASAVLFSFSLAAFAPSIYSTMIYSDRLTTFWPRVTRVGWSFAGAGVAWLIVATGRATRLETIFTIMGAVFAPMAGAMAADYRRSRGVWLGPRRGVNLAGLIAWAAGVAVGLLPLIVRPQWSSRVQPAAVFAFVAAFLVYGLLARLGIEPPTVPLPPPSDPGASPPPPDPTN